MVPINILSSYRSIGRLTPIWLKVLVMFASNARSFYLSAQNADEGPNWSIHGMIWRNGCTFCFCSISGSTSLKIKIENYTEGILC